VPGNFDGAVEQSNVALTTELLEPFEAWHENQQSFWSNQESSRLALRTSALGLSVSFLRHPWSGIAEICLDGKRLAEIDLFEAAGSMRHWIPIHLGSGEHVLEVVVTGRRNVKSHDCQVHVLELESLRKVNQRKPGFYYSSRNRGNSYPECFDQLLAETVSDGLVLDCGSGDRNHPDPRVTSFEYSRFQGPDIFGDGHGLPFKDCSFDLVLSQAVIEHLHDPFKAAREIFRVLKPGGRVYVESAFIQPLHAVPFHFFNTTAWGLERLFADFKKLRVTHEGALSVTLEWFYRITALRAKGFGEKVDRLIGLARELDEEITAEELKNFSSYVTLLAIKPNGNLMNAEH
jgi:SAM-dependent methyltransferase